MGLVISVVRSGFSVAEAGQIAGAMELQRLLYREGIDRADPQAVRAFITASPDLGQRLAEASGRAVLTQAGIEAGLFGLGRLIGSEDPFDAGDPYRLAGEALLLQGAGRLTTPFLQSMFGEGDEDRAGQIEE